MKKILLIFVTVFSLMAVKAQVTDTSRQLVNNTVYEKVYLHVDREAYAPREDIWFKVYLVSGISNRLIQGYKNVYVQLLNDAGLVVDDRLILVNNGVAQGDFKLSSSLKEGQYTIRAFTKYQKNFGEESYFLKKVWISEMKQQETQGGDDSSEIDLGFYPESGSLVLNASNTIAFKAVNSKGYGIDVSGFIINDLGDTITPFHTDYLGMGKFALMPLAERKYTAILSSYPSYTYEFTDIQEDGVTLQFRDEKAKVKFGIVRNFSISSSQELRLTATHKGVELFTTNIDLNSFYKEIEVSKEEFPLGISKMTISNEEGVILAERLIFISIDLPPVLSVSSIESAYQRREKVNIALQSFLGEADSIVSGLSISVVNKDYLSRDGLSADLRSFLLLDSELKGPIESSGSYFSSDAGISSTEKLDLLMLVQGWRSYYWPEIVSKEPKNLIGWDDIGITVKGHVKRLLRDQSVVDGKVIIGPFSSSLSFLESYTDEDGGFYFDRLYLLDSSLLMVQAKSMGGSNRTEVFIDKIYRPEKTADPTLINEVSATPVISGAYYRSNFSKLEAERKYAIESGTYWLEEVEVVTGKKESVLDLTKEADRTYGSPQRRFEISEADMNYINVFDYLEGKLPGVVVSGNTISIRGGMTPAVLLDDVINDLVDISTIPMGDIDHIDIFMSGAQMASFGSRGADGVIAIYTKMGSVNHDFQRFVKGRITERVDGFQSPRKFYSPKYTIENLKSDIPDYRPTLYWNPFLDLKSGTANLEFFTSDFSSSYAIIVEGISAKGVICTGFGEFEVR